MSKSGQLTTQDYKQVFLLLGECRELGADAFVWRRHLLEGTNRLLGDCLAIVGEGRRTSAARNIEPALVVDRGWDCDSSRRIWLDYMALVGLKGDPIMNAFLARFDPPHRTAVRRQIIGDRDHYESGYFHDYLSRIHVDDSVCSFHQMPDGRFDIVVLHRRSKDRPWNTRELKLLDLLHREIVPMIGRELASADSHDLTRLPPRLQQALDVMLEGLSEKEAAARLLLSEHTVHQYVKALYRRYRVRSRTELLALWIRRHRLSRRNGA